jgi:glucose/arabinose dehydrogenase
MTWTNLGRQRAPSMSGRRAFRPSADGLEDRIVLSTLPAGFTETPVATGLNRPTTFEFAPDGRIFIAEQGGQIRVVKNGALLPTPFLSLNVDSRGERGLLGVAFDPSFAATHFVYVYYTVPGSPAHNRVSRFTANGDVVQPGSEHPILDLNALSGATNHNGGGIHFGPDGKLYVGVGENANGSNAQTLGNRLGKVLRINPDGSIPIDNPFFNVATGDNRAIWALGLRNPFSFAFQPGTGRMFIDDVGENTWEEINLGVAGANYGWPATEGPTTNPNFRGPIFAYQHNVGIAITAGTFYNPATARFPADAVGDYFFTDLGGDWIHRFDPSTGVASEFATNLPSFPVGLGVDPAGSLYYLAMGGGQGTGVLARIQFTGAPVGQAPWITRDPSSVTAVPGRPATFSVQAAGTAPLFYQWQKNGVNIPGATGASYTIGAVSASDLGASFRVVVRNAAGAVASGPATVIGDSPFVRNLFAAVLHRAPDAQAMANLTLALARGVTPQQVALAIVRSAERHVQQVVADYQKFLGRSPTPAALQSGVAYLNSGGTRAVLDSYLVSSAEYIVRHGRAAQPVIRAVYQDLLGRAPSAAELAFHVRNFSAASVKTLTLQILASTEARTRLITGWYVAYLNRRPTAGELNQALLSLRNRVSEDQVEASILSSPQFLARA